MSVEPTALEDRAGGLAPLLERIEARQARIGIIGLGYVGLPLAVEFARAGFDVTGFDVDELSRTYYGRQVLDALGFTKRRKTLDKTEFEKVKSEFQKIKLALPEAVEPTTTEKYFALDVAP